VRKHRKPPGTTTVITHLVISSNRNEKALIAHLLSRVEKLKKSARNRETTPTLNRTVMNTNPPCGNLFSQGPFINKEVITVTSSLTLRANSVS
jgi:hypothetical protein